MLGIYILPILTAAPPPSAAELSSMSSMAHFQASFRRDLADSDTLHWGDGEVSVGKNFISFNGKLAPGPDYYLYLSPQFIETEKAFVEQKHSMIQVSAITSFNGFAINLPETIDINNYNSVIIWCESFGEFITAAQYR